MSPMTAAAIFRDPAVPRFFKLFLLAARPSKCGTCVDGVCRAAEIASNGGGLLTVQRLAGWGQSAPFATELRVEGGM